MKYVSQETLGAVLRPFEIEHMKLAARFKDAPGRTQHPSLLVGRKVVEHERGEHAIKRRLGIRKLICKSLVEPDGERCARCLASSVGESLGVGIESNYLDIRMKPLDHRGQRARAAADVEN